MNESVSSICITCDTDARLSEAKQLSTLSGIHLSQDESMDCDLQLRYLDDRVELYDSNLNTGIHVDFVSGALAHREQFGGGRGQALAKAIGLKHGNTPSVLDITAGLARDAYILASLGCSVTLVEQSPVLYTLIRDGIKRGLEDEHVSTILQNFMNLVYADSVLYMEHMSLDTKPDVIYLDPMYPERKKSALVKKDMQILHKLIGEDESASTLLQTALDKCNQRVVVKRPSHAEPVAGPEPHTSISSKKTRYDCYMAVNN